MPINHKILVVDDEIEFLNLMEKIILDLGYPVITATNGLEGVEKLKSSQPVSVIISDQKMPKIEGNAFLQMAKEISPNSQRVMITAFRDPKIMEESVNSGEVFRFLHKPIDIESVEEIVKTGVKRYEQILSDQRELKKKEKTIHDLVERLHRKPVFEKVFIFSLLMALVFIVAARFFIAPAPYQRQNHSTATTSSNPKIITITQCLESAQSESVSCEAEVITQFKEKKLTLSQKSRRQASCEAIHLQKRTICEARY